MDKPADEDQQKTGAIPKKVSKWIGRGRGRSSVPQPSTDTLRQKDYNGNRGSAPGQSRGLSITPLITTGRGRGWSKIKNVKDGGSFELPKPEHRQDGGSLELPKPENSRDGGSLETSIPENSKECLSNLSPYAVEFVPLGESSRQHVCPLDEVVYVDETTATQIVETAACQLLQDPGSLDDLILNYRHIFESIGQDSRLSVIFINSIFCQLEINKGVEYILAKFLCVLASDTNFMTIVDFLITRLEKEYHKYMKCRIVEPCELSYTNFVCEIAYQFHHRFQSFNHSSYLVLMSYNLIVRVIKDLTPNSIKQFSKLMKLMGGFLKKNFDSDYNRIISVAEETLVTLGTIPKFQSQLNDIIQYMKSIEEDTYGSADPTEANIEADGIFYGPDGQPLSAQEYMFAQSQTDEDKYIEEDSFSEAEDDDPHFTDEMNEAFEAFLKLQ